MEEVQLVNFSTLKKKAKKGGNALNFDNINLLSGKKTETSATTSATTNPKDQGESEYTYDFLYDRICNLIKKNNPTVTEKTKISL